jgi:hypothetical protein
MSRALLRFLGRIGARCWHRADSGYDAPLKSHRCGPRLLPPAERGAGRTGARRGANLAWSRLAGDASDCSRPARASEPSFRWIVGVRFVAMAPTARENGVRDVCRAGTDCRSYRAWQTIARQPQSQHPKSVRPNRHHVNRRHCPGQESWHSRDGDVYERMRQSSVQVPRRVQAQSS